MNYYYRVSYLFYINKKIIKIYQNSLSLSLLNSIQLQEILNTHTHTDKVE